MVANNSRVGASSAPPRELNVLKFAEARASELESLHSVVAGRLNNDFRSRRNKRRRTTGHDDRIAKRNNRKRSAAGGNVSKADSVNKDEKKISRRVRRRIEFKKNLPSGFIVSGDGTKRLRTHVWHAKRFTMSKYWGFYVPLGLHGRGRGSRAILKKLKRDVLINDASYCGCVQLEGPQDVLIALLRSVMVPPPSACCESSLNVLSGAIFGTAMLHDTGRSYRPPIAPVSFMWRPLQQVTTCTEQQRGSIPDEEQSVGDDVVRRLWLWIDAAAFEEAYGALRGMTDTARAVSCVSLEGKLGKLDLMGSKLFRLLQKILIPSSRSVDSWHLKKHSVDETHELDVSANTSVLGEENQIFSSGIVPFLVNDPRALNKTNSAIVQGEQPLTALSRGCHIKDAISSLLENKTVGSYKHIDLWDASEGLYPPVEESVLCTERNRQRNEFFRLVNNSSGPKPASGDGKYSSVCPVLLLKNGDHQDSSVSRYSVILPLSWVKVFWNAFISNGAHAIGLREKHWVASELGLPYFPWDFPDCNAYSHFMAMEAAALNHITSLRPPSKRSPEVPIPPPWNCIPRTITDSLHPREPFDNYEKSGEGIAESSGVSDSPRVPFEGIVVRTSSMLADFLNTPTRDQLLLFPKHQNQKSRMHELMKDNEFVTREAVVPEPQCGEAPCYLRVLLHAYKEGVFEQGAVVCAPHVSDIMLWTNRLPNISRKFSNPGRYDKRSYVPNSNPDRPFVDLTVRSGSLSFKMLLMLAVGSTMDGRIRILDETEDREIQLPQSSLYSYFVKLQSGEWKVEAPRDPAGLDSHRWPIGFITSGFVRGSKKATASALCEAHVLSKLRAEQWRAMPVKRRRKEIYVLVRNLRSTAYRLALATVLLEQNEDLEVV